MNAETVTQPAGLSTAGSTRWAGASRRERNFYIALGVAALLHASAFIGVYGAKPKDLGDPSGQQNAISVSLVTEADLQSRSTVAEPPVAPPMPAQKPQPAPPPQQPKAETPPEPQPPQPPEPDSKPEPEVKEAQPETPPPPAPDDPTPPKEQEQAKLDETKPEDHVPDLFALPEQTPDHAKSEENTKPKTEESKPKPSKSTEKQPPKPKQQKAKPKKMSQLDLSTPNLMEAPSLTGRAAAFQRPPGITKSGLNDAFARAVIRALQQTMPQLQGALGRVTVRIFLSESGNVIEVKLLGGAKDSSLNQSVVFAAQQTSYPIPPTGSNTADRTFMVTYIYD